MTTQLNTRAAAVTALRSRVFLMLREYDFVLRPRAEEIDSPEVSAALEQVRAAVYALNEVIGKLENEAAE